MYDKLQPGEPVKIEAIKYYWREWYTKVTEDTGRILHWGPWNSRWAAQKLADILMNECAIKARRRK